MKKQLKKLYYCLPKYFRLKILAFYELSFRLYTRKILKLGQVGQYKKNTKPKILFYHISGLSFGGSEKSMQIIAKHLSPEKFDIYYMYSAKSRPIFGNNSRLDGRLPYLTDSNIKLIEFDYQSIAPKYPYLVNGMNPSVHNIIKENNIDLFITAGTGHAEYPVNVITNIPIIMINIFGGPNAQKNICYNSCISHDVATKFKKVADMKKTRVMYIQSEGPTANSKEKGMLLREKLGINDTDIVFGRIGRGSDQIFDEISIRAFQKAVQQAPSMHYLIMSPPPILEEIVKRDNIKNVHFLPPSPNEDDIWAFHQAIDAVAHFRKDGESCGLNIAEAMLCAKPVISHRSFLWNAHLEYLESEFSRIAPQNDQEQYAKYLMEFTKLKHSGHLEVMGQKAKEKAEKLFSIKKNIFQFEKWIEHALGLRPIIKTAKVITKAPDQPVKKVKVITRSSRQSVEEINKISIK